MDIFMNSWEYFIGPEDARDLIITPQLILSLTVVMPQLLAEGSHILAKTNSLMR